jgi:hypothetical protein
MGVAVYTPAHRHVGANGAATIENRPASGNVRRSGVLPTTHRGGFSKLGRQSRAKWRQGRSGEE